VRGSKIVLYRKRYSEKIVFTVISAFTGYDAKLQQSQEACQSIGYFFIDFKY